MEVMNSRVPFSHEALESPGMIRLLLLQPAANVEEPLIGSLIQVQLENASEFVAISYAWGEPRFTRLLHLDEGTFRITRNLSSALRRFRLSDHPRAVWADQVSINQVDKKEKAKQVGMMSQIYKRAETVLVWLGDATEHTKDAISCIEYIAESYGYHVIHDDITESWWRGPPILKEKFDEALTMIQKAEASHIEDLYSRDWFSRLWIVQEVVLARTALLCCGESEVKWTTFASALTCLQAAQTCSGRSLPFSSRFESACRILEIRQHHGDINEIQPSLVANKYEHFGIYMYMLRKQICWDDRDRVYALHGLKPFYYDFQIQPEEGPEGQLLTTLNVDYDKPAFDVYREWALDLMSTGDLNFILGAGIWQRNVYLRYEDVEFVSGFDKWQKGFWRKIDNDGEVEDEDTRRLSVKTYIEGHQIPQATASVTPPITELPSWVPDLSNLAKNPDLLPWMNIHIYREDRVRRGFAARSNVELGAQGCLQFVKWNSEQGDIPRKIWVRAVLLGQLSSRIAILEWCEDPDILQSKYMLQNIGLIKALVERFVRNGDVPWPIEDDIETALARTVFADGSGLVTQTFQGQMGTKALADPEFVLKLWHKYEPLWNDFWMRELSGDRGERTRQTFRTVSRITECLSETLEGHNFFITKNGFMGLAPLVAKEGDIIALIDSVRVPVVLRSVEVPAAGQNGVGYIVVGPCYSHGVMYGETLPGSGTALAQEGDYIPLI